MGTDEARRQIEGSAGNSSKPMELNNVNLTLNMSDNQEVKSQSANLAGLGGPILGGPNLAGPILGGPNLSGPNLAGPKLAGPIVGGPKLAGPLSLNQRQRGYKHQGKCLDWNNVPCSGYDHGWRLNYNDDYGYGNKNIGRYYGNNYGNNYGHNNYPSYGGYGNKSNLGYGGYGNKNAGYLGYGGHSGYGGHGGYRGYGGYGGKVGQVGYGGYGGKAGQ